MNLTPILAQASPVDPIAGIASLANIAGYIFAAFVFLAFLREGFKAWKEGAFVPKAQHDEIVKAGLAREDTLRSANLALIAQQAEDSKQMVRMTRVLERQATILERIAKQTAAKRPPADGS